MKLKAFLCSLVAVILFSSVADAQLFRRNVQRSRSVSVQPNCPGGVCPTAQTTRQAIVTRSSGHWSYPGTIDGHLQSAHGVSTASMTREQMLDAHDAIHEGRSIARPAPAIRVAPTRAPVIVAPTTSIMQRSPQASDETFGLSELVAVEIPKFVLAQVDDDEPSEVSVDFRRNLAKAVVEARKSGKINARDAVKLRVALMSPAFVERAQQLAVTQVAFNGEASEHVPVDAEGVIEVEGINWDGLLKFLEALVPLLLTLLKAFGA